MTNPEASGTDRAWVERTSVLTEQGEPGEPLAVLARVRDPHLAPLVRVSPVPGGCALTHLVPAGSVPVSTVRAAAPLRAGHVVAVALAVVEALAALHHA